MKTITVKLRDKSYPILVGYHVFEKLFSLIELKRLNQNLFIILDKNVDWHFGKYLRKYFNRYKGKKLFYLLDAHENSKSFNQIEKIYSLLMENRFGRDTLILAIGGGVTGDLAGFAASTFMRGVQIVHIPTTLMACIDSSIGGKTAINFKRYKNIIGSFHQPQLILCDILFLSSLPKIEMIAGMGEMVKYAFTTSKEFYNTIDENMDDILLYKRNILEKVIMESIIYKASVVSKDEKEISLRKVLNFGHTFAHAFERELKGNIKHGEAVIAGILCALHLSYRKRLITKEMLEKYKLLPLKLKLNNKLKTADPNRIYENMFADKKNTNGIINFVLLHEIGEIALDVSATKEEIINAINSGLRA